MNIPQLKMLQELHHEIHKECTSLYFITFDRRNKTRPTIISGGVEILIDEMPFRRKKLKVLEAKTIKFLKALLIIEKKVKSMHEHDFKSGWLV